ncbi:PQQ-binding-like beta-propeller repeat protein [Bacillus sp. JJ1566]|uniref:Ig-like domain-containing protein n=1 Tax=Bacillus sp. JJ1566 TaxID=3122961 RepID=UPI002FFED834
MIRRVIFLWLFLVFCFGFSVVGAEESVLFEQGKGYEKGAYQLEAPHPTSYNWTRQSKLAGPSIPEIKWKSGELSHDIAIDKYGIIYTISSLRGDLLAYYPSGALKWRVALGDVDEQTEAISSPVVARDGTIYLGVRSWEPEQDPKFCKKGTCYPGALIAMNPNGTEKWRTLLEEGVSLSSPAIDKNGNIYIGTGAYDSRGKLYLINPSGDIIWSYNPRDHFEPDMYLYEMGFYTTPTITKDGYVWAQGMLFKDQQFVEAYDASFGSATVGDDGTIYNATYVGSLLAQKNGYLNWELLLDESYYNQSGYWCHVFGTRISSTPAISEDGTIYIGGEDGNFVAFNLNEIEKLNQKFECGGQYVFKKTSEMSSWSYNTGSWLSSAIIDSNGVVYVTSNNSETETSTLYAFNKDGSVKWKIDGVEGALAIGKDKTIYSFGREGLVAIGQRLPKTPLANPVFDDSTIVTGAADPYTKISVKVGSNTIGSGQTDANGKFSVPIPIQSMSTELFITSTDNEGNMSEVTKIRVKSSISGWVQEAGTWYYYDEYTGKKKTGWLPDRGLWYYLDPSSGAMKTGWIQTGGIWYYLNQGGVMQTGWRQIGGTWYYFNKSGSMQTGWLQTGGTWYYLNQGGAMQTGWLQTGGTWYYLNQGGAMQTGWLQNGGAWYYLKPGGAMQTGWLFDNGTWYYLQSSGKMHMGWLKEGTTWYYLRSSGSMQTGWAYISGIWYYFYSNGIMR